MTAADDHQPHPVPDQPPDRSAPDEVNQRYRRDGEGLGRDLLLDRTVALRSADVSGADDLVEEARFLARLDHPGGPGVLDLVRGDGGALLVSRQVEGITLAQAIERVRAGQEVAELASPGACAALLAKVADVVAAAHARGIVHRDLSPDAIVLGLHGLVVVERWQTARAAQVRPLTLRYAASTPVGEAIQLDGSHEDIQALGRCLHGALALQEPEGVHIRIGYAASCRMPPPLEAVVRKALVTDAVDGYRSVAEFALDLARFGEGRLPAAYRPGPFAALLRAAGRHRRVIEIVLLAVCCAALTTVLLAGPRLQTYAAWGRPLATERFADDAWRGRWLAFPANAWERRDGRLVSAAPREAVLIFTRRLATPVAVEYTGRILPDSQPCDLSVVWSEDERALERPDEFLRNFRYMVQAGAFDNSWCAIFQNPDWQRVDHSFTVLPVDRDLRFRVEINQDRLAMWIDGKQVLAHRDLIPSTSGFLALYGFYPGKAFANVRVWQQDLPRYVDPLAVGDSAFQFRRFDDAAAVYARIAQTWGDENLGQRALFKQGLALHRAGDSVAAATVWSGLPEGELRQSAEVLQLDDLLAQKGFESFLAEFRRQWDARPGMRPYLRQRWQVVCNRLGTSTTPPEQLDRLFVLRRTLFPEDSASSFLASGLLLRLGRFAEVATAVPDDRRGRSQAFLALGRARELLAGDWARPDERIAARIQLGELAVVADDRLAGPEHRALAWCKLGRWPEALAATGPFPALLYAGRAAELLDDGFTPAQRAVALLALGRVEEAAALDSPCALMLLGRIAEAETALKRPQPIMRLVDALSRGAPLPAGAQTMLKPISDFRSPSEWVRDLLTIPLIERHLGDAAAPRNAAGLVARERKHVHGGRGALVAAVALGQAGREAVAASPWHSESDALLAVALALQAELSEDCAAARAGWRAYLELPVAARLLDNHQPHAELELLARWRADGEP